MSETAMAIRPPTTTRSAPLDVEDLYRECADDLYAYVQSVVRDRSNEWCGCRTGVRTIHR